MKLLQILDQLPGENDTQFHFLDMDRVEGDPCQENSDTDFPQNECMTQWDKEDQFNLEPDPKATFYWETDHLFRLPDDTCTILVPWAETNLELPDLFSQTQKASPLQLTDPQNGILRQKVTLNLAELSEYLLRHGNFMGVGNRLAVYRAPVWNLLTRKDSLALLSERIYQADAYTARHVSSRQRIEIYDLLLNSPEIERIEEVPPADPHLLCCKDGLYLWPENDCLPSNPNELRFSHLDISVQEIGPQCTPYFDEFLDNVTQGALDLMQLILEVIGVIITGYPVKSFFLFQGVRDSGKSLLSNLLQRILGENSCFAMNSINQLSSRWLPGMLPGKLLCVCGDVPNSPLTSRAIGTLKQLTGNDSVWGEIKGEDPFVFHNYAKLLFLSNFSLRICGQQDPALVRRCVVVPFRHSVPEDQQDPYLSDRLFAEVGGIIWRVLNALQAFEKRGGIFTKVAETQEFAFTPTNPTNQERISAFVHKRCVLEQGASTMVPVLYSEFLAFDRQEYPDLVTIPKNIFSRTLYQCGLPIHEHRTSSGRGYFGIRLK